MSSLVFPGVEVAPAPGLAPLVHTPPGLTGSAAVADGDFPFGGVPEDASSESSSIGSPSSEDEAEEEEDRGSDGQDDEAQSKSTNDDSTGSSSLGSLSSLEDSLPIKKGLSTHFAGKSRSFSNLSECAGRNAGDLAKQENPFNKRRRIQIASKISYKRRASCSSLITTALPPLLSPEHALHEETEEEEDDDDGNVSDDDDGDGDGSSRRRGFPSLAPAPHGVNLYHGKRISKTSTLKSPRSFPLFDLRYA